ncbi:MAG: helix-turn-helix transcriptional regulator [Clostridia bacterium]|nr:helix-turn-helix transcriptional regulator [Clostridia bacterium]
MKAPISRNGIPVFTEESFPRPEDKVYIHLSSEYPDFVGVTHSHKYIEIVYILSGSAEHETVNGRVTAQKGDLFIINPDVPHAFYGNKDSRESFCAYDLMFVPDFFDVNLINSGDFSSLGSSFLFYSMFPQEKAAGADLHFSNNSYNDFGELFNKIHLEYNRMEQGYVNIIRAYVIELIVKIFRRMDAKTEAQPIMRKSKIIDDALVYLRENYSMHMSVSDLASHMFLSRDYFSKLFRNTTGMTVTAFLKQLRINESCRLLLETDQSVLEIAQYCGFHDMKHFYTAFRSQTGKTPGEYRKSIKG